MEVRCPQCGARVTLTALETRPGAAARPRPVEAHEDLVGQRLGDYRLTAVLGGGGMGIVFEATREAEGPGPARAAVKVLSPLFAQDPEFVARFRREADALIQLRHPHLIEVYEKGEHPMGDGPPAYYFVMERFEGDDLRRRLGQGPLPVPTALAIIRQAAEGLAYAHQHGIVHRDIKPANILVRGDPAQDGLVKVVDFGVAQLASSGHTLTSLTRSDLILGTLNYMSPEQRVDASRIDHRADIYALGVVAYELLTGSLPLGAFETPSELRPELPVAVDAALLAALRRDPAQRPASVQAFAQQLLDTLRGAPRRRGWAWATAAAALLVAGAGGWTLNARWGSTSTADPKAAAEVKAELSKALLPPPQAQVDVGQAVDPVPRPSPELDAVADALRADREYTEGLARPAPAKPAKTAPEVKPTSDSKQLKLKSKRSAPKAAPLETKGLLKAD